MSLVTTAQLTRYTYIHTMKVKAIQVCHPMYPWSLNRASKSLLLKNPFSMYKGFTHSISVSLVTNLRWDNSLLCTIPFQYTNDYNMRR